VKVVCGLGNPGSEYQDTRHNVGWWLIDLLQKEWRFESFRRVGNTAAAEGCIEEQRVRLLKPLTYMNRSGAALGALLRADAEFDPAQQLLVVVDDVALPVGRVRIRPHGSAGGHKGLLSIEAALQSREYARLRIGVGGAPPGVDLADYVLSPFGPEDQQQIHELLPALVDVVRVWILAGTDAARRRLNR
jgi:PTH1 family peptidyl-tRNA hydrolase